jgi:hypothetical protein
MEMTRFRPGLLLTGIALVLLNLGSQPTFAEITPQGQQGCAAGTIVGGPNRVNNGDFALDGGFTSELPNRGRDVYPDDPGGGGYSIQTGEKSYQGGIVVGRPFGGDTQRDVSPSQSYFYSNPNKGLDTVTPVYADKEALLWSQNVQVTRGTTYNFFAYFDNLLIRDGAGVDPLIELRVDGRAAGPPVRIPKLPDVWVPIQFSFTTANSGPDVTTVTLQIVDLANDTFGDDFGMTQINLKQCVSGMGVGLGVGVPRQTEDGSYAFPYTVTVKNLGVDPLPITNIQLTADLATTFAAAELFSVVRLESAKLSVNPGFNGRTDQRLLQGNDSLGAGEEATLTLVVQVKPGKGSGGDGPFSLTILATAKAGLIDITDRSARGINPDPNGNGDPKDPSEDQPTIIDLTPDLRLPMIRV